MKLRAVIQGRGPYHVVVLNERGNEVDALLRSGKYEEAKAAADRYNESLLMGIGNTEQLVLST